MITAQLAKIGFDAYKHNAKGLAVSGQPIPEWKDLTDDVRQHWMVAAEAQRKALIDALDLNEREVAQLRHALHYSKNFSSAGVSGSGSFILLAKLSNALGFK